MSTIEAKHLFSGTTDEVELNPKRLACENAFNVVKTIHKKPLSSCMSLTGATGGDILQMLNMDLLADDSTVFAVDRDKSLLDSFVNSNKNKFSNIVSCAGNLINLDSKFFNDLEFFHFDALSLLSEEELSFVEDLMNHYMSDNSFVMISTPVMARVMTRPKMMIYHGTSATYQGYSSPFEFDYSGKLGWKTQIKADSLRFMVLSAHNTIKNRLSSCGYLVCSGIYRNNVKHTKSYVVVNLFVNQKHSNITGVKKVLNKRRNSLRASNNIRVEAANRKIAV